LTAASEDANTTRASEAALKLAELRAETSVLASLTKESASLDAMGMSTWNAEVVEVVLAAKPLVGALAAVLMLGLTWRTTDRAASLTCSKCQVDLSHIVLARLCPSISYRFFLAVWKWNCREISNVVG
jgi:hypothetical protein